MQSRYIDKYVIDFVFEKIVQLSMAAPSVVLLRRKKESFVSVLFTRIPAKADGTVIRDNVVSMPLNGVRYTRRGDFKRNIVLEMIL